MIDRISQHNIHVLISGEIGTGKHQVARTLHHKSPRSSQPFIYKACGPTQSTIKPKLSCFENGALLGIHEAKEGKLELADMGTVFLDEVSYLSLKDQLQLLKFLEYRNVKKEGGLKPIHSDVRIIASTSKDLEKAVAAGTFLEELYHCLNPLKIIIPPLRSRKADIPLIAKYYLEIFSKQMGNGSKTISPEAFDLLVAYDWPGNVRELKNIIERAVILAKGDILYPQDFPKDIQEEIPLMTMEQIEKQQIAATLKATGGVKTKAASLLGISRATLYNKLKYLYVT
jgi:DNA-binding NtrC family response regulator